MIRKQIVLDVTVRNEKDLKQLEQNLVFVLSSSSFEQLIESGTLKTKTRRFTKGK